MRFRDPNLLNFFGGQAKLSSKLLKVYILLTLLEKS
jgi:hypothetical protein